MSCWVVGIAAQSPSSGNELAHQDAQYVKQDQRHGFLITPHLEVQPCQVEQVRRNGRVIRSPVFLQILQHLVEAIAD